MFTLESDALALPPGAIARTERFYLRHDGKPVAASFLQPIYFRHPGVGGTTP